MLLQFFGRRNDLYLVKNNSPYRSEFNLLQAHHHGIDHKYPKVHSQDHPKNIQTSR